MKQSIHTPREAVKLALIVGMTFLLGLITLESIRRLSAFHTPLSLYIFLLLLVLIFFLSAFKLMIQLTEQILITDEELCFYRCFHQVRSLRWSEIQEIGIGQVYTPAGIRFRVYFARRPLSFAETDNLDMAENDCFYLETLTEKNLESVSKYCPEEELLILRNWVRH